MKGVFFCPPVYKAILPKMQYNDIKMFNFIKGTCKKYQTKFSFGSTSAIMTNLGLIVGLDTSVNARVSIIAAILVIALADNISDSFGIHMYQESEHLERKEIWLSTSLNFLSRFLVSLLFVFFMAFLPLNIAVGCSLIYGLLLLAFISYIIAVNEETNVLYSIISHIGIAVTVIIVSDFVGRLIIGRF